MSLSYDAFAGAFLSKINEYDFVNMISDDRVSIVDGYLKRAVSAFKKNCKYDLFTTQNDETREFNVDVKDEDLDELVDIISEGMVLQWLKPFVNRQELLENVLNTRDFTTYSPAELLMRIGNAHATVQKNFIQMIREYSFNHGNLRDLHL